MREIDTRWGSNGRACKNLLEGIYITNADGHSFWVLLFKEMSTYYNDWKTGRLEELTTMLMMEELQVNCALEYEAGLFFEAQYAWHAMPGELTNRPGLRTMELPYAILDQAAPFWVGAMEDPESRFPETFRLFQRYQALADATDDDAERERLLGIIKLKTEQLVAGIRGAYDEMAKMQEDMFSAPLAFLLITPPEHGAGALRAILKTCQNGGLDLDTVFDYDLENSHLIDENLEWSFLEPDCMSDFEKNLHKKLEGTEEDCIHFLRQFGLMQCKCRNEMKMITHERGTPRQVDSSTRLMDFANVHGEVFDLLWCVFAFTMSATRIIEAAHGYQRESWDGQRSFSRNDAQLRYIMKVVYGQRQIRRILVYEREGKDEEEDKKAKKASVKHSDRKYTCLEAGKQTVELMKHYSTRAICKRIPEDVRKENSISAKRDKGMQFANEEFTNKEMELNRSKQQKNLKSSRRNIKTLDQHRAEAKTWHTKHDLTWNTREEQELLAQVSRLLTKEPWRKMPAAVLEREVKAILPAFWAKYKKSVRKFTKTNLLKASKSTDTWETNLGKFLSTVTAISDGKAANTISTKRRAKELKNATKGELLVEFVKADRSEWLATLEEGKEDELDKVRNLFESNGAKISSHKRWEMNKAETKEVRISFRLTQIIETDDEEVFGLDEPDEPADVPEDGDG